MKTIKQNKKDIIFKKDGIYKFNIKKVRENAKIRTKNRTWVEVIEEYNKKPIVDWVLIENEENWETFYKLVCLMHFIVKKYIWNLSYTWKEYTTWWKWYNINELINTSNVAPNAYVVSKKAVEMMWRLDKTIIVTDFSKTLTSSLNSTTWSIFAKSWFLWEKYTIERNNYYNLFHNYEIKWDIEKTKEWWDKHLSLFIKYWLTKEILNKVINNDYFEKREWLDDFMVNLQNKNIKLVIISSWILDVIKIFLSKNWFSQTNIEIFSNKLLFNPNWEVIWFDKRNIITTLDKSNYKRDFDMYWKVILLWDDKGDLSMYNWNCLKIWFCDSNKVNWYDLYLWDKWNINDVLKYI